MNNSQMIEQEKSVLRWGGLADFLGSIIFLLAMILVSVVIDLDTANLLGGSQDFQTFTYSAL